MTETIRSKERVWAVDALRGFAVMAIILLHNIEHFNFYSFPETASPFLSSLDTHLWDMLFFAFAGKSYAIFALLFGFTFYLQHHNCEMRRFSESLYVAARIAVAVRFCKCHLFPG